MEKSIDKVNFISSLNIDVLPKRGSVVRYHTNENNTALFKISGEEQTTSNSFKFRTAPIKTLSKFGEEYHYAFSNEVQEFLDDYTIDLDHKINLLNSIIKGYEIRYKEFKSFWARLKFLFTGPH